MDFIEERTPQGVMLKILFNKWQFLAFDKKGKPVFADQEGRSLMHKVPLMIFVGESMQHVRVYDKEYSLLKIRNGTIVVPYIDVREKKKKYFFVPTEKDLDMIPMRMISVGNIVQLIREVDITMNPDYIIVDDNATANDIILIKGRYKVEEVIYIELVNNYFLNERMYVSVDDKDININTMSTNPVFLAQVHLRNMDLAKLNQLMLDFEIPAIDIEFILNFITSLLASEENNLQVAQNHRMLEDLKDSFSFYLHLLKKSDADIRDMINSRRNIKTLAPFVTLVSKVKSLYPGKEDQLLYTEYENLIMDRREEILKARV
jgi:hypothetical protein